MFDPNKYDKTNSQNGNDKLKEYIDKVNGIIKYLLDMKPLILKECEALDKKVEENPNTDMAKAFEKKLDGWSRLINGTDILNKMYLTDKK